MVCKIIPLDKTYKILDINKSLHKLFTANSALANIHSILANASCNYNGTIALFYFNTISDYCYYFDAEIEEAFLLFVKNFINEKVINNKIAYTLIKIAQEAGFTDLKLFELFNIVHWPSSKKGIEYFNAMSNFSDKLKQMVFNNKVALKDAYFLTKTFKSGYDEILNLIPSQFTFSEVNEVVRSISEYAIKNKKTLNDIVAEIKIARDGFKNNIYNMRYPMYSKYHQKFKNYLNQLNLPKGVDVIYDNTFEKEDYTLEIKFNNFENLAKKVSQIKKDLDSFKNDDDFRDLFKHNELFDL